MTAFDTGLLWLALILTCGALVASTGALMARSLFALCMHLVVAGALAAGAMLAMRAGDAGIAAAMSIAAWTPVLLLATTLLSARTAKPVRRGAPLFTMLAAVAATATTLPGIIEIGPAPAPAASNGAALGFWLAPLLLAAAAACAGLLGYGERGAFQDGPGRRQS